MCDDKVPSPPRPFLPRVRGRIKRKVKEIEIDKDRNKEEEEEERGERGDGGEGIPHDRGICIQG